MKLSFKAFWFLVLFFSLSINLYWGWYFYPSWFPHEVNIPNHLEIIHFCYYQGYDSGYLDSFSCKENEVMCYKKFFDMNKNKCIKWNITEVRNETG